jgi:uncharacterized repeat protein (TIGR03803 family)
MKIFKKWSALLAALLLAGAGHAQTLTSLYSFPAGYWANLNNETLDVNTNGFNPYGLTMGNDGNFYGTAWGGGSNGVGTIFKMTTGGTFTISELISFSYGNGENPPAALTLGNDGNFYGTTRAGGYTNLDGGFGYGTVFKVTPTGVLTTLVSFANTNGGLPYSGLTLGNDGNFYGTTYYGGTNGNYGTVFKVTTNGTLTMLVSFANTNGANPYAALTLGNDGNFYGTTSRGGTNGSPGYGTVFNVTTNGTLTRLVSFANTNGANPQAALTLGEDGNFYGTTAGGGTNGSHGTLFKVTANGTLTTLVSFNNTNGAAPEAPLTFGQDGNLYGVTVAGGTNSAYCAGCGGYEYSGTVFELIMPPPPSIGITMFSNFPVVIWPASGTNFVLQSSTNLASPNWANVSNGIPFFGIMVTNTSGAAFFRLH